VEGRGMKQRGTPQSYPYLGQEARCLSHRSQMDSFQSWTFYELTTRAMCYEWAMKSCCYGVSELITILSAGNGLNGTKPVSEICLLLRRWKVPWRWQTA
jgi:hypothetical protein